MIRNVWLLVLLLPAGVHGAEPPRAQVEYFEKKIRPVLVTHCYKCHSAQAAKVKGGLLLDTRDGLLKGGASGPAIIPGDPTASLLLKALRHEDLEMPPGAKLPDSVIADFQSWIKQGAADPRAGQAVTAADKATDIAAGKKLWSFQPPRAYAAPQVRNAAWLRTKIDAFILARLEQAGLAPSPPADRQTWLRRVSFDLTGLPPTPEEIDAFVSDPSPDAPARVVERLLESPHYGEHWARLWLDVARFAEDQAHIVGSNRSLFYPNAYLYRDWVIRALNQDMPYDRFIKLQLAADLIAPDDRADQAALGFMGLGPKYYGRGNPAVMADEWEDRVDTLSRGLLGLTVACARCHNHKFDPIPTEDYYALAGVFASTRMFNRPLTDQAAKKQDGEASQPTDAMHIIREGTPTDLNVFVRGDIANKGPLARRHFLHVLCDGEPKPFSHGSGRKELAEAIASSKNPLTARVIVNRIWAQHFGRPLVATPSNFGALGERPTHAELLDDLAVRFMETGWSLKWLQREIVLSAAYGQSSKPLTPTLSPGGRGRDHRATLSPQGRGQGEGGRAVDPDNRLLSRMNRRRLSVEAWRDAVLAATGRLQATVGGPSLDPQDPKESRRTVYSAVSRLELNRMLALFDYPDPNVHADHRTETTTPLQKLFVLNSPFMVAEAANLAQRLQRETPTTDDQADRRRIERAYRLLYGRPATEQEVRLGLAFLTQGDDRAALWQQYAQVLLAANEMLFVD
jgi:hypothetical protein